MDKKITNYALVIAELLFRDHISRSDNQQPITSYSNKERGAAPPTYRKGLKKHENNWNPRKQKDTVRETPRSQAINMEPTDYHSDMVHNDIVNALRSHSGFRNLAPYDTKTIKKRCKKPEAAIRGILNGSTDINVSMIRFALAVIDYERQHPDQFPMVGSTSLDAVLLEMLSTLAAVHGLNPREYAMFYSGLLVSVNILTGTR